MQSVSFNIVLGIVTGLLTASVLLILKHLFLNSFLPWYRQTMYKGIDLEGNWYLYTDTQKTLLELKQTCESLTGKATVQVNDLNDLSIDRHDLHIDDIRTFDIKGSISERFVLLKLQHTNHSRLGIVTYLLQIDGDGTKLKGQGCWYAPLASDIISGDAIFYRNEERAVKSYDTKKANKNPSVENSD